MDASHREQVRVHVRWMVRRDMADVVQIEQASFQFAWTEDDFLTVLRQRNCIGMAAELGDRVIGYMIYELGKHRLEIANFAVHPDYRRAGVGSQMVAKLVNKLSSHRRTRIWLAVRESNLRAQVFFRRLGFKAVRVLRHFYEDSDEDAFRMEYRLDSDCGDEEGGPVNRIGQYE